MKKINLYIDNNLANLKEVSYEDVYQGLKFFPLFKIHYPNISFENCLRVYIGGNHGLKSTYDEKDFTDLFLYCWDQFKQEKPLKRKRQKSRQNPAKRAKLNSS